jgi:hypothetical protein
MGVGFLLEGSVFYVQRSLVLPLTLMLIGSGLGFVVLLVGRWIYAGLLAHFPHFLGGLCVLSGG